jgi:hypothetical protein
MASITHGRPRKEISWDAFEEMCNIQCTQGEIAAVMRISVDTLRDRAVDHYGEPFSVTYNKFTENGKSSLRRLQFKLAKTNAGMCIWLGKQYLNQRDNIAMTHASPEVVKCFEDVMKQIAGKQKELLDIDDAKAEKIS